MCETFLSTRSALLRWIGWFYFGNAVIFWLLSTYYFHGITPLSINLITHLNATLVWVFLIATWVGYFALLAFLPSIIALLLLIFCNKRSVIFTSAIFCSSVAILCLAIDMVVYGQYHFHLNSIILKMVFSREMSQIFDFTWLEKSLLLITVMVIFFLEFKLAQWLWHYLQYNQKNLHGKKIAINISASLFLSYNMFLLSSVQPTSIIYQQPQAFPLYTSIIMKIIPKLAQLPDFDSLGADMIWQPQHVIYQRLHYPLQPLICRPQKSPLNIVIIAIDTWRFDMLNQQVTPYIQQFAQQSWQFNNHWSGGNTTQPGIFSLFYGLPESYWSASLQEKKNPVLIQELLQQNYMMGIFASASLALPAFNKTVFAGVPHLQITTTGSLPSDRDQAITNEFEKFIAQAQQQHKPFFSFLFYDTAHSYCTEFPNDNKFLPIISVCNRFDLNPGSQAPLYLNRYKNALAFDDNLVEKDLTVLKQHHLLNNTVIIITADHGNEFDDNQKGYWGHGSNFTQYQVRTPLIIYWPGEKPQIFQQQTSHYDIAPTLLTRVLGCTNSISDYSIGNVLPVNQSTLPFLIVNSYIDFGIIQPNRITTIYSSGNYDITDNHAVITPGAKPDMAVLSQAFKLMKKYYY